ncbi:MAG: hypothetical protein QOD57_1081, partial [Actinomycetota bacterium]|nr:hypothetical protein [Actinomycetota bacterium]
MGPMPQRRRPGAARLGLTLLISSWPVLAGGPAAQAAGATCLGAPAT